MFSHTRPGHVPSLDGIRAVSVTLVFVAHAGFGYVIPGGLGVTVFFFLSGFLITTLLSREWEAQRQIAFGAFYLRRAVRLLPALVLTMLLALCLVSMGWLNGRVDTGTLLSQLLFVWNYYSLHLDGSGSIEGLGILWSLSVEEHFYLLWPLLFVMIARGLMSLRFVVALTVAILVWRSVRFVLLGDSEWVIYISTDTRFDSLLFGCLLALMQGRGIAQRVFTPGTQGLWILLGLVLLVISLVIRDDTFRSTLRYSMQGVALMPLFYFAVRCSDMPLFRWLNWGAMRAIGTWSYTIYLSHLVIMHSLVQSGISQFGSIHLILVTAPLCVGFSAMVYYGFERPLKPLRQRLSGRPVQA
jgi:peptidoglycan/LPS O-acetylase OafA/YrhL